MSGFLGGFCFHSTYPPQAVLSVFMIPLFIHLLMRPGLLHVSFSNAAFTRRKHPLPRAPPPIIHSGCSRNGTITDPVTTLAKSTGLAALFGHHLRHSGYAGGVLCTRRLPNRHGSKFFPCSCSVSHASQQGGSVVSPCGVG